MVKNTTTLYQLSAHGDSLNGWRFRMRSQAVFRTHEEATAFIPEFIEVCCDETRGECADRATLKVEVVDDLELH